MRHFFYGLLFVLAISFPASSVSAERIIPAIQPDKDNQNTSSGFYIYKPYQHGPYRINPPSDHNFYPFDPFPDINYPWFNQKPNPNQLPPLPNFTFPNDNGEFELEETDQDNPEANNLVEPYQGNPDPNDQDEFDQTIPEPNDQDEFDQTIPEPNDQDESDQNDPEPNDRDDKKDSKNTNDQDDKKDEKNTNKPKDPSDAISKEKYASLLNHIKSLVGKSDKGWDCSAFVQAMYKKYLNIQLPRISDQQYFHQLVEKKDVKKLKKGTRYALKISRNNLKPGDLVFFKDTYNCVGQGHCTTGKNISHVGIFIGGNTMIDCSLGSGPRAQIVRKTNMDQLGGSFFAGKRYYIKR